MRNSPMIEFPVEEFEWRLERLTNLRVLYLFPTLQSATELTKVHLML